MRPQLRTYLLVAFLLLFINFPLAQSTWTRWQVERNGEPTAATLVEHEVLGSAEDPRYWVSYRVSPPMDDEQAPLVRRVDKSSYDKAVETGQVSVLVRDDNVATSRAEGQVAGRAGLLVALALNLLLLAYAGVLWRFGSRWRRPAMLVTVRIEATQNVVSGEGDPVVEEGASKADPVLVRGIVEEITDHDVVLRLPDRSVIAVLDGHLVRVADGELGEVRGRYL